MASVISSDTVAKDYPGAVRALLGSLGMAKDWRKCLWCNYPVLFQDREKLECKVRKETEQFIGSLGHDGVDNDYHWWYVGLPEFKVIRRTLPHLACQVDLYYVASHIGGTASWGKLIDKADSFEVPLVLLHGLPQALAGGKIEPEEVKAIQRQLGYTAYQVNGYDKEWKVPDAFSGFIWALWEKGESFDKGLLDPWSCRLVERLSKEPLSPEVPKLSRGDYEDILSALTNLGTSKAKAKEAAEYVMDKYPDASLEDKIKHALNYLAM